MLESNCMLIAAGSRGLQSLFTCTAITSHLRRWRPNIWVSCTVLLCGEKWTGSSMVSQVANNWVCVRVSKTDFNWSFELTGRSLRVTTHHLVVNLVATELKNRVTFQIIQWVESHQIGPPVRRLIIHSVSACRQFEFWKSGASVSRKETCCQKINSPWRCGFGKKIWGEKGGR